MYTVPGDLPRSGRTILEHRWVQRLPANIRSPQNRWNLGRPMGFEPTTTGITIQDSTAELRPPLKPLSWSFGAPDRTRTCYPRLRRPVLYPDELRAHEARAFFVPSHHLLSSTSVTNSRLAKQLQELQELVGAKGFEPSTSWSQTRRATGLRYAPKL